MSETYFSRTGEQIEKIRWEMLRDSPAYKTVRKFENELFMAEVRWIGTSKSMFRCTTTDKFGGDKRIEHDSNDRSFLKINGKTRSSDFPDAQSAINAYEDFLVENTDSEWVPSSAPGGLRLLEVGNQLVDGKPTQDTETAKQAVIDMQQGLAATPDYGSW